MTAFVVVGIVVMALAREALERSTSAARLALSLGTYAITPELVQGRNLLTGSTIVIAVVEAAPP